MRYSQSSVRLNRHEGGFTLIEVMVVVVILAILATVVVPRIMDRPDQARVTKARQDIRAIGAALNLYRLDNFRYPDTDEGLEALVPKYLDKSPVDPWQSPYLYLSPGEFGDFDLYSLGADGEERGEGVDADIGNWNLE
ncbi:MAG: type II secretion system major pseudopilin GspG [Pseudomonadota bacterium]